MNGAQRDRAKGDVLGMGVRRDTDEFALERPADKDEVAEPLDLAFAADPAQVTAAGMVHLR